MMGKRKDTTTSEQPPVKVTHVSDVAPLERELARLNKRLDTIALFIAQALGQHPEHD